MNTFNKFYNDIVSESEQEDVYDIQYWQTQRKNTDTSYRLQAQDMKSNLTDGDIVVDYGCGWGLGAMYFADYDYVNYDPYPQKGVSPDFTDREALVKQYNGKASAVMCNLVLNVIDDPKMRVQIVQDIVSLLRPGGIAYIVTRNKRDVESAKTKIPYQDGYIMTTATGGKTFQKGFDNGDLKSFIQSLIYDEFTMTRGVGSAGTSKVKILKKISLYLN